MGIPARQANFLLPSSLIEELRNAVARREQSRFVAAAVENELRRLKLRKALDQSFGAWNREEHSELKRGSQAFVRRLRKSSRGGAGR